MNKIQFILIGILLSFIIGSASTVSATVWSGDITNLETSTILSFGDGSNNLNAQWFYPGSGIATVPAYLNTNTIFPGTSDAWVFNLGKSVDINTLNLETVVADTQWADLHISLKAGEWVAFKGLNGYYGVWHIQSYTEPDQWGRPGKLNGTWYFQDDGTGNFGSTVPAPGAIWLLFSGLIGVAGFKRAI